MLRAFAHSWRRGGGGSEDPWCEPLPTTLCPIPARAERATACQTRGKTMYVPAAFAEPDVNKLHDFIEQHSFGLFITQADELPFATHLPFLLGTIRRTPSHGGATSRQKEDWKQEFPTFTSFAPPRTTPSLKAALEVEARLEPSQVIGTESRAILNGLQAIVHRSTRVVGDPGV